MPCIPQSRWVVCSKPGQTSTVWPPFSLNTLLLACLLSFSFAVAAQAQYPGLPLPVSTEASDLKSGSILFYNLYVSNTEFQLTQDTAFTLTNTHASLPVTVRIFFVRSDSSVINGVVHLTPL